MTRAGRLRFAVLASLSEAALRLAVILAPSPHARVWLVRGINFGSTAMAQEIAQRAEIERVEIEFDPHDVPIPERLEG